MVYAKLDWYSVVLYNRSISDVMRKLKINVELYDEMMSSGYERSMGFTSNFILSTHGISIELKYDDYLSTQEEQLFQAKFAKIRLDISGTGLDYLRSIFDVDKCFTDITFWGEPEEYKITRSDFAFDFVNYKPGFVDKFLNWIKSCEMDKSYTLTGKLRTGRGSGISYSYRCGDQKTLYLGSPRADKLVRIYDKLLQYSKNGIIVKDIPIAFKDEGKIESWFRIEFQTRRKCADSFLFCENGDLKNVLRVIFDDYLIRDENNKPLDFLVDLYKWEDLPPIIQNQKYTETKTVLERAETFVKGSAFKSVFILLLYYGVDKFVDLINARAKDIYLGTSSSSVMGSIALRARISAMLEELKEYNISIDDLAGSYTFGNDIYIGCTSLHKIKTMKGRYEKNVHDSWI